MFFCLKNNACIDAQTSTGARDLLRPLQTGTPQPTFKRSAGAWCAESKFQTHPGGRVVAGVGSAAHPFVHAGICEFAFERRVQKQMVNAPAGIFFPMLAKVIPESVDA